MGIIDYIEQRNRERVFRARVEDSKRVGLGMILGLAVGAGIGLLTAPKSGEETRQDLVKKAREAGDMVREKTDEYVNIARDFGSDMGNRLTSIRPAVESGLDAAGKAYHETTAEKEDSLRKKAEDVAEEVKKGAKEVGKDVKDAAEDVAKDTKKAAENVEKKAK